MNARTSQCSDCGAEAALRELGGLGFCASCRERKFQAVFRSWTNGVPIVRAVQPHGLTQGSFNTMLRNRGIFLRDVPHRKRKRTKRQLENNRQALVRRAKENFLDLPLPVDKKCNCCGEIKLAADFYVYKGKTVGEDGRRSTRLSNYCRVCQRARVKAREQNMDPEVRRVKRREIDRAWRARVGREYLNEIAAFKREKKRREEGRERAFVKHSLAKKSETVKDIMVPIGPFQDWIDRRADAYAVLSDTEPRPGIRVGLLPLAQACGMSDRSFRRFLDGEELISKGDRKGQRRKLDTVPLATVDDCLTREGTTLLSELYSEDDFIYTDAQEFLDAA